MQPEITTWGFNPGQRYVKDCISVGDKRKDLRPYPAVIAPWAKADDTGLARRTTDLTASVGGAMYIGGEAAERLPMANRQMDDGRLDPSSPIYQALAQMSAQRAHLTGRSNGSRPKVIIATALPVAWRLDDATAEENFKAHLHTALDAHLAIKAIYIQSEPNAVVSSELLDDKGAMQDDRKDLTKAVICVGDLGGGTINLSVLEGLRPLPGQSSSPPNGSSEVVKILMQQAGMQYVDAERRLAAAVATPGADPVADRLLKQYREATVSLFQEAWKSFTSAIYLFAGGTVHWVATDLQRAFSRARIAQKPQQAIAIGLYRYARRKAQRGA